MDFKVTALHEVENDSTRVYVELDAYQYIGDDPYWISAQMPVSHDLKIGQVLSFGPPSTKPFTTGNITWHEGIVVSNVYRDPYVNTVIGIQDWSCSHPNHVKSKEEADLSDEIERLEAETAFNGRKINEAVEAFIEAASPKKKKKRK
jgi:hypothetical protein